MRVGEFVTYVAPYGVGTPEEERREYPAIVTEVCGEDPNNPVVGLFIFWPRYGNNPYRPISDAVEYDDVVPYGSDTWHHVVEPVDPVA